MIKEVISAVDKAVKGSGLLYVGDKGIQLDASKFVHLQEKSGNVVFIDGGQCEIIGGANFSLQFIRVCAAGYANGKRVDQKVFEYYALIKTVDEQGIIFRTEVFGGTVSIPDIRADDNSLKTGARAVEINQVTGVVRKVIELDVMCGVAERLNEGILVRDGDLQCQCNAEQQWWDRLKRSGIDVVGLCKTGHAISGGSSANYSLLNQGPEQPWYYRHTYNGIYTGFVKLHPSSKYVFRVDCFSEENLGCLIEHATDPIFYGYPYGLVVADKFGRVSNNEQEFLRVRFMHACGALWKELELHSHSLDAHKILDSI